MTDLQASASGYGYVHYIDCNSALALLSFILFIDLLRDIVQQITTATTTAAPRRRRSRSLADYNAVNSNNSNFNMNFGHDSNLHSEFERNSVLEFIQMGGADGLYEELPHILLPLITSLSESSDGQHPTPCLSAPLCDANAALVRRFGEVGRIIGSLLSNVLAKAFTGGRVLAMQKVQEASRKGRQLLSCDNYFTRCKNSRPKYQLVHHANLSLSDGTENNSNAYNGIQFLP
ncbi:uncharacterized protein LOC125177616 [Hyalella azteca]|uniref:Uncharacterized protein LOC125177616 n=1 Tax=Hyalella azteca TaxID=294128 RepID=A0A979FFE6_HYAAZ|nr:uncharacterized protein LOC125177616 [Hyalella azteca]